MTLKTRLGWRMFSGFLLPRLVEVRRETLVTDPHLRGEYFDPVGEQGNICQDGYDPTIRTGRMAVRMASFVRSNGRDISALPEGRAFTAGKSGGSGCCCATQTAP
jgi:hypothetical protein